MWFNFNLDSDVTYHRQLINAVQLELRKHTEASKSRFVIEFVQIKVRLFPPLTRSSAVPVDNPPRVRHGSQSGDGEEKGLREAETRW